ncbi:hypothetical protein CDD81_7847 [Ophiocordyceps australis]|uniref:WSC domain-containing protein n=1 Tax=Ophiocordyceps australis TaxID=1399860 RepID=A0A2C5YGY8_9HYPO|nr:hypothetical protein CDD81_7847 [Ophiocordyceps australis]
MRHRTLVCVCLCLLTIAALGSVRLIADQHGSMERRGLIKRQFHLGGLLTQAQQDSFPSKAPSSRQSESTSLVEASSINKTWMSATARLDDVTETRAPPEGSQDLVKALTEALREAVKSAQGLVAVTGDAGTVSKHDTMPLEVPGAPAVMGRDLPSSFAGETSNEAQTLRGVLDLGVLVINIITSTMRATTTLNPGIVAVLDDVTAIVYSAAHQLEEPLCSMSQIVQGIALEAILPCSSAAKGPVSINLVTLSPTPTGQGDVSGCSASWNGIPLETYGPVAPPSTILGSDAAYPQQSPAQKPSGYGTDDGPLKPTCTLSTSCPVLQPLPCPTCPSCDDCPCKQCTAAQGYTDSATSLPSDASPCPGRGSKCADCPDGFFCPAEENGAPAPTAAPISETASVPSTPLPAPATTTAQAPANGASGGIESLPRPSESGGDKANGQGSDWSYLGCFQDAMDRTLVGATSLDVLRGDMNKSRCIGHCFSQGYYFAGTEYSQECWCGLSIRQEAVKLSDEACNMKCQGDQEGTLCGGEWAVSVYMCQAPRPADHGASSGAMRGTAEAVAGAHGETMQPQPSRLLSD